MSGLSVNIDLKTDLILNIHHKESIQSFLKQGMEETASRLRPSGERDTHTHRERLVGKSSGLPGKSSRLLGSLLPGKSNRLLSS